MGWVHELDGAVQARLEGMLIGGEPALRSAGPLRSAGRSALPPELLAAERPSLFYCIDRMGERDDVAARVQALLIAENLRGPAAAWRGTGQAPGAYELAEAVARTLFAPDLAGTAGAWLARQRLVSADGRMIAFEQEYEVLHGGDQVLLDGQDLLGARSIVRLADTRESSRWQVQVLGGAEQVWAGWQGRNGARLVLSGTLWAADAAALTAIEGGLDALLVDRQLRRLEVSGRPGWSDVALTAWQRAGARLERPLLGVVGQSVSITFEQYKQ
jgi:hypothetical protein